MFSSFPPSKPAPGHINSLIWDYRDYRLPHPKGDPGQTCGASRCPPHQAEEETEAGAALTGRQRECWVEDLGDPLPSPPLPKGGKHGKLAYLLGTEMGAILESYPLPVLFRTPLWASQAQISPGSVSAGRVTT